MDPDSGVPEPGAERAPTTPPFLQREVPRRSVLIGMGTGAAVAMVPAKAFGAVVKSGLILTARPSLVVSVVRPDDFLHLTFRFVNLQLDTSTPNNPILTRIDSLTDALVVVDFGPQHVTEACLLYTSPSPRDRTRSRMPSSA